MFCDIKRKNGGQEYVKQIQSQNQNNDVIYIYANGYFGDRCNGIQQFKNQQCPIGTNVSI